MRRCVVLIRSADFCWELRACLMMEVHGLLQAMQAELVSAENLIL